MSRLGQCFGFRLQALVLGLDVFLVVGFCGLSTGFWSGIRMGSRVWPGAGLGWAGGPAGYDNGRVSIRLECECNQELQGSKCWWVFQSLDCLDQSLI